MKIGRADSDGGAIGAIALTALHRMVDAGATATEMDGWLETVVDHLRRSRTVTKICEGR